MTHEYFMKHALREAQNAYDEEEVPIGAIIVMHNKIIARVYNQVEKLNDSTAHAEIIALTSAFNFLGSKYLPEATLYVTIEPCIMCAGALYWSKVGTIVYGANDEKNGYKKFIPDSFLSNSLAYDYGNNKAITSEPFHPKTTIIKGIIKEECAALLRNFFKARR